MSTDHSPPSPTLSVVYTSPEGQTFTLHDFQCASNRSVTFIAPHPERRRGSRTASNGSLRSAESRLEGTMAYRVMYAGDRRRNHELERPIATPGGDRTDADETDSEETVSTELEVAPSQTAKPLGWFQVLRSKLRSLGRSIRLHKP